LATEDSRCQIPLCVVIQAAFNLLVVRVVVPIVVMCQFMAAFKHGPYSLYGLNGIICYMDIHPTDIWIAAGVLLGFQVTAFAARINREVAVGERTDITWWLFAVS
jgi:hypothetical protein